MRAIGPDEDDYMRAYPGEQWRQPARPQRRPPWSETAQFAAWREHSAAAARRPPRTRQSRPGRRRFRWLTGSLAAGLLLLALVLVGVQFYANAHGMNGPGIGVVIGHFVAAGVALALQAVADRRGDARGALATLGVFAVVSGALWLWWWS